MNKQFLYPLIAILLAFSISGCGLVQDAGVAVSTIQLPAGKLYSSDFYATATPEMVKDEIGGKTLATETYTYRTAELLGDGYTGRGRSVIAAHLYPLLSNSRVDRYTTTPVSSALRYADDPEVIRVLMDAGSPNPQPTEIYNFMVRTKNPESLRLLRQYLPQNDCTVLNDMVRDRDDAYPLLGLFPDFVRANANCTAPNNEKPLQLAVNNYAHAISYKPAVETEDFYRQRIYPVMRLLELGANEGVITDQEKKQALQDAKNRAAQRNNKAAENAGQ